MSELYNHKVVEKKWQKVWDDNKAFAATDDYSKPKYYALVEFPYPSGQGLHVGHPRPYTALDIVARKRRMQGYNVLYPMGWDAFGLPTETILPTLLRNYDRDSMAAGVEIRMPFLDYRIVEFAFSIGWRSKLHGGFSKSIVRDAGAAFMPKEIVYRRTKLGFNAPILDWMRGPYRQFFEDTVASADFANCSLIDDPAKVRSDLSDFLAGKNASFHQAADIWNRIQPYLWERALIKQDWIQE